MELPEPVFRNLVELVGEYTKEENILYGIDPCIEEKRDSFWYGLLTGTLGLSVIVLIAVFIAVVGVF